MVFNSERVTRRFFSVILSEAKNRRLCGVNDPEEREGKAFDV